MAEQQDADGLSADARDQSSLDSFLGHQPYRPAGAALRRIAADHGDDALALLDRKQACRAGPLLVVERPFETALLIAPGQIAHSLPRHGQDFGDPRRAHSFCEPQQRHGAHRHTDLFDAASENLLQRLLILLGDANTQGGSRHISSMPQNISDLTCFCANFSDGQGTSALTGAIGGPVEGTSSTFTVTELLNVFAFRPDLNLGAFIKALQSKSLIEILAEPNLVTTSGKEARFLVGGEFPIPILQGGAGAGAVTIQFREFGIRIDFLPELTENGSIKMQITPEVSALDFANAVTFSGFLIPALSTRRIQTEVELMPGQSFVIGGLIDNRVQETINRIPGLSHIPLLGQIFKSRTKTKNNTELLVLVTPEFPEVYEPGDELPEIEMPIDFLPPTSEGSLRWKK